MSTVSSVTSASNSSATASTSTDTAANPSSTLNQNDFLKLLVAQLQYQDPMNPQSNTDMAAQMAQFTSLQQATQSTSSLAMMQANGLVGSTVSLQVDSQTTTSGVVSGVVVSNGTPQVTVGGKPYSLSQVIGVTPTPIASTTSATNSN